MVILVFAVGQLAVDQVAQCVIGVFDAVVFFEAVAADKVAALPSAVLSERMLWAGSKAKVSLRPVWLLRAS